MNVRWISETERTEGSVVVCSMPSKFRATQSNSISWTERSSGMIGSSGNRLLIRRAVAAWLMANTRFLLLGVHQKQLTYLRRITSGHRLRPFGRVREVGGGGGGLGRPRGCASALGGRRGLGGVVVVVARAAAGLLDV